jgi:hypothetical protein
MTARAAIVTAMVAIAACSAAQRAKLVSDTTACVLDSGSQLLQDKVTQAALGSGDDWVAFSQGELISRGVALAICVGAAAIKALDRRLPGDVSADGSGRITPNALVASSSSSSAAAASCANPAVLLAHDRLVDFLARYGVDHSHKPAGTGVQVLP